MSYIGLHALALYAGLGVFAIVAYPVDLLVWRGSHFERHNRAENALTLSVSLATFGACLKLISYINSAENGIFTWYCIGHLLICFSVAITTTTTILVTKYLWRDLYALVDAFSSISFGLVISFIVTLSIYTDSDRFFTKVQIAQTKSFWVMVAQAIVFGVLLIYNIFRRCLRLDDAEKSEDYEAEIA